MGKNNLDSIKLSAERILPDPEKPTITKVPKVVRKDKETDSVTLSIKITQSEMDVLKEEAGELVPTGTYVKHFLRTKTKLFTKSK